MASSWVSFLALYASVFFLLSGIGLLGTLLSLQMTIAGYSAQVTGLIMAAYYVGIVAGSFSCHRLIQRVGHIRAFAAFAAVTLVAVMLHGLYLSAIAWGFLRFMTGVSQIGLYMVIESWLNECAAPEARGRVFAVYMVLTYLGLGVGQVLLNAGRVGGAGLFFVIGILLALSMVPVSVTQAIHPGLPEPQRFSLITLMRRAPLGMLGCLVSGLLNSAFYSMGPVFGHQIGLTASQVGWFMAATIFGGFLFQWPVGSASDRFDRTTILGVLAVLVAIVSAAAAMVARLSFTGLIPTMGIFGGLIFVIYPVAVARTHDVFEPRDVVPVSSALLLFYGIGASIGPIASSLVMTAMKAANGLFVYVSLVSGGYAVATYFLRKKEKIKVVPVDEQVGFVPMRSTSQVVAVFDPRAEVPEESEKG